MSDIEEDHVVNDAEMEEEHEQEEEPEESPQSSRKERRRDYDDEEEEEDDDDEEGDEDDEEDEEDDEDDPGAERGKKRAKHRHKRPAVNRFLDVEAEVDEDEEEEEEEEEYGDEFIADVGGEGDEDGLAPRAEVNARLNRERELNDQDLQKIAAEYSERYRRTNVRYTGDMNDIPQRLLMPSVHDANLWQVRVKQGKERDLVFSLMRKTMDLEFTNHPLQILSAFQRDSLPGMIYVEARSMKSVTQACQGLVGVYLSRGVTLVPIEEMASLLQIKKQDLTVTPGTWVRIRRGKYQGDLAQVMDVTENGEEVGLKFIPRIDLNPKDEASIDGKKRKKVTTGASTFSMRPPQRFFNYEEVVKVYGRKAVSKRNQAYVFQNDTYKEGFIEKDFKLSALQLDDVNPTLDEITRFTRGQDGTDEANIDLSIIAEASRKAAIAVLQPGDHIEVFEGEQAGVHGTVHSIEQDVVTIQPVGLEFDGQRISLPARSVRKRFKPGDHVKVMTGKNVDETGLVVSVMDNVVTFLSDMTMQEVSVFSKDLREAAEVGNSTNTVGNYELHDLVQLDLQTVGVIFKTERDSFRVLDQNSQVRLVQPHQISMRRDSHRAIATDAEGHELRVNDNVKEVDGLGRKGRVLHTHQSFFAFLHNRDYAENGGVFVTRARSLVSLAPKGNLMKLGSTDLSKMNPAMSGGAQGGMVGSGNMGRGPRDRLIGVAITVVKGPYKGYAGTVKDTNGNLVRVELLSGNKIIQIERDKLKRRNPDGTLELLENVGQMNPSMGPPKSGPGQWGSGRTPNPYANGGRTPGWAGGRTPNPYANADGRTPAWNAGKTPDPYSDLGGKTPAWSAASRTPNPYAQKDSGKTPAWNASARTPNPYASNDGLGGWGGATPGRPTDGWGGATPAPTSAWGGATPGRPSTTAASDWGSAWEAPSPAAWNNMPAATPAAAATPGPSSSSWGFSVPTPAPVAYDDFRTPAADANSLWGASAPDQEEELGDNWLLKPAIKSKRGLVCEIHNSFERGSEKGWMSGDYEGEKVVVRNTFEAMEGYSSRCIIKWYDKTTTEKLPDIPVQYLRPVQPTKSGEEVCILAGEHIGKEGVVREVNSDVVILSVKQTHLVVDVKIDKLCKIVPVSD